MTAPEDDRRPFALLRRLRLQRNLSQEELADTAGISVRAVRDIEAGRVACPRLSTIHRLAEALGLEQVALESLTAAARARRRLPGRPTATGPVLLLIAAPQERTT